MLRATIVLPCYNEGLRLDPGACRSFLEANPGFKLLFVDDGSTDLTQDVLKHLHAIAPEGQMDSVALERNSGKAAAVRAGFLKAMYEDSAIIGFMDSDLATPLEEAPRLIGPIERGEVDIVLGSRVAILGSEMRKSPLRHCLERAFAAFASLALEMPVYDAQCGAKFFRNCPDLKSLFAEPFDVKWTFDVELLARLKTAGSFDGHAFPGRVIETPLKSWTHKEGSKVRPLDFLISSMELARIRARMKRKMDGKR